MCPPNESQEDKTTGPREDKDKGESQTDRRELLKSAVATAAGAAAILVASGKAEAATTSGETEAERKRNIDRFLHMQAENRMAPQVMRARKPK